MLMETWRPPCPGSRGEPAAQMPSRPSTELLCWSPGPRAHGELIVKVLAWPNRDLIVGLVVQGHLVKFLSR